ncbi:MAG: DUF1566 domain-containing protein [Terracidiphilus sp.]
MAAELLRSRLFLFLFLAFATVQYTSALTPPKDWWPDPATGLMWTGEAAWNSWRGITWSQANEYCSTLQLGGFSGWRLPTIDEADNLLVDAPVPAVHMSEQPPPSDRPTIWNPFYPSQVLRAPLYVPETAKVWTSTAAGKNNYFTIQPLGVNSTVNTSPGRGRLATLCVRPMEPDILSAAKEAQVSHPVPDARTLRAGIPLRHAYILYQQGNFQESISQAQAALALKPDLVSAAFDIGLCYAALKQWNQALATFQAALKLDTHNKDTKKAIAWADRNLKAAASQGKVKLKSPEWRD